MISVPPLSGFPSGRSYLCLSLTAGKIPATAGGFPSSESYSHLLGHWCRSWHPLMDFLLVGAVHSLSGQWDCWGYLASAHSFGRSSQCPPLKPKTHTHTWSTCRQCPIVWQHSVKEDFMVVPSRSVCLPIMLLYLSGRHRFLFQVHPQLPQFDLFKLFPHLSLGLNSGAWTSGPDPHPSQQSRVSGWRELGGSAALLCRLLSVLPSSSWLLFSPLGLQISPSSRLVSLTVRKFTKVQETFLLYSSLPEVQAPLWFLLFLFPFVLLVYEEFFLLFHISNIFCQCSEAVMCDSFHLLMYFQCFCERRWTLLPTPLPSWSFSNSQLILKAF